MIFVIISNCNTSKVFLHHGALLKQHGAVYLNSNDILLSVFQKIGIPKFILNNGAEICDENNRMMPCTVEINEREICPGDKVYSAVHWRKYALEKAQR